VPPHGQAGQELAQCRPTPAQLDDRPATDEAHHQPVPEQGQGHGTDRDDERDTRPGCRPVPVSHESSRHRQQPDDHLSAEDDQDPQKELEPAEALRLSRRDAPLGTDRDEPVQESRRPRLH